MITLKERLGSFPHKSNYPRVCRTCGQYAMEPVGMLYCSPRCYNLDNNYLYHLWQEMLNWWRL